MGTHEDEQWLFVRSALETMKEASDGNEKATSWLLIPPESPLTQPIGTLEALLISSLSKLVCDDFDSISWWVYECDYGRKPLRAGTPEEERMIDSYDQLRWLIETVGLPSD